MKREIRVARQVRGVSLVEALVALAVMAFGMLGVVGMQTSLRTSADQSRQRSEAVRIAQEEVERLRTFGVLAGSPADEHDYAKIATAATAAAAASSTITSNTQYFRTVTVVDHVALSASAPRMKTVQVAVTWQDRLFDAASAARDERRIELTTAVARASPELAVSLSLPTNRAAPRRPDGRNINVPPSAVDIGGGTSRFNPPNSGGEYWIFNNDSGLIQQICPPASSCIGPNRALLAGYVRFATGVVPTAAMAEAPTGTAFPVSVNVAYTAPLPGGNVACFTEWFSDRVDYYCAVPLYFAGYSSNNFTWSGISTLVLSSGTIASSANSTTASEFKVCRYTAAANTDFPPGGNAAHPRNYTGVATSLTNQNFLVISAVAGAAPYGCPADDNISTPLVNTDTRLHQPQPPP